LGNLAEAKAELARIAAEFTEHPDVLEIRWALAAHEQLWSEALQVAQTLVRVAPKRTSGWLHRAYALRRAPEGGLQQAWEALLPVFKKFPREPIIAYNLSCYACQMQDLKSARAWLRCATFLGGKDDIKRMAACDPDLEPLWPELEQF
jgi:Flp pilus assembly protein TadD